MGALGTLANGVRILPLTQQHTQEPGPATRDTPIPDLVKLMEADHPPVRDIFPVLVTDRVTLLEEGGGRELAACARNPRLVVRCGCGDDFCQSIRTEGHPEGRPYGPGHLRVTLNPAEGILVLDVVDARELCTSR